MEDDEPIEHPWVIKSDRERAEEGRGAQLRHPQEPARVRRRDEPAAQDDLRAAPADPRGALRARADRGREEEGQDRGATCRCRPSRASTPPTAWRRSVRPMLGAHVRRADRGARPADPNAPRRLRRSSTSWLEPAILRSEIYRQFGAYPDIERDRRGSRPARSIGWPTRSRASLIQQRERLLDLCEEMLQAIVDEHCPPNAHAEDWDLEALARGDQGALQLRARPSTSARSSSARRSRRSSGTSVETVIEAREAELALLGLLFFARHFYLRRSTSAGSST